MHAFCSELEVDLPSTPELAEPCKDQTHRLLNSQIGIKAETGLAVPRITEWHTDPQFAPSRFGACCVEHAGSQDAEFELADAAFHAEQQSVIWSARVVNPFQVDHPCLDEPAQLKEVMPIASVTGETRGIEAQHGSDFTCTQPGDEAFETGSSYCPASRPAQIIVDHLDLVEAAAPSQVDQFVLATRALGIKRHQEPIQGRH